MEEFTPEKIYHPEDEYEALDSASQSAETEKLSVMGAPGESDVAPVQDAPFSPAPQAPVSAAPVQQAPYYPMYQQPSQQMPQQPIQYYTPSAGYPQTPPQAPVYPQSYPQPAQPYTQTPVQQAPVQPYTQAPSQQTPPAAQNVFGRSFQQQQLQQKSQQTQKPPTPTGTKVFIIILCAILAAMVLGFIFYITNEQKSKGSPDDRYNIPYSIEDGDGDSGLIPFGGEYFNNNAASYTDVEDDITLKADNGDTQKRDDDNPDSVGKPDEKAKNITLEPQPKDKDDAKYSTQSAYNVVSDSVVTVICYDGEITGETKDMVSQGTGTIISADGYLITNAHVIGNSRALAVNIKLNNGDEYPAKIVGYDTWTDLAVLKIDAKDLKPVTFGDSKLIEIGDDVIAIGSPGGEKFQNSLTKGIVSAVDRELPVSKNVRYIQSDAAISPGSSGGPLCNIYGQVIGITTAKTVAENYENMSFSIPSATVEEIVGDLMHYGYVKGRTRIGLVGKEVSYTDASGNAVNGVEIDEIDKDGSLAGTDIKAGDIITELDGKEIKTFQDIYDVLAGHKEGDKISIKVSRPSE